MKFFTVIFSFLISLIVLEILTRLIIDDGMNYEIEMMKYANRLKVISNNKDIGIEHKKNKKTFLMGAEVTLNSKGFRGNELKNETKKILMLGDSMTFGWGAKNPFPNILNKKMKNFEVINAGIGNTNTNMQINNFFENFKEYYKYDLIILNFFINDFENVKITKPNIFQKYSYAYTYLSNNINQILIRNNMKKNWNEFYSSLYNNDQIKDEIFANILKLKNYCKENNINFIIHNIPELRNLKNYQFKRETDQLKNFALDNDIKFINSHKNLIEFNEKDLWVSSSDPHANDKAHKIIADFLLKELNKIK